MERTVTDIAAQDIQQRRNRPRVRNSTQHGGGRAPGGHRAVVQGSDKRRHSRFPDLFQRPLRRTAHPRRRVR